MKKLTKVLLIAAILTIPPIAFAADALTKVEAARRANIAEKLQSRNPRVKVVDVVPSPVTGIYEVYTGDQIIYADSSGDYVFLGPLVNTDTKQDLTEERMNARNLIDYGTLPFDKAIKVVKGSGARQMAVFSDPDCPYCQQLEQQIAGLTDVTIFNFLYPIASLHPEAEAKGRAIWCAEDRALAWEKWMRNRTLAPDASCEINPIEDLRQLGRELKIVSTPTLFFPDGRRFAGTPPAGRLTQMIDQSQRRGNVR